MGIRNLPPQRILAFGDEVLDVVIEPDGVAFGLGVPGLDYLLDKVVDTVSLESGDGDNGASETAGELPDVDLIPVLLDGIHHVEGDYRGDPGVQDLEGEEKVPLQVGGIHDVDDGIGV